MRFQARGTQNRVLRNNTHVSPVWVARRSTFFSPLAVYGFAFYIKAGFFFFQPFPNFRQVLVTFELRKAHLTTWLGETMYVSVGYDPELETHPFGCQKYIFLFFAQTFSSPWLNQVASVAASR